MTQKLINSDVIKACASMSTMSSPSVSTEQLRVYGGGPIVGYIRVYSGGPIVGYTNCPQPLAFI